jgi:hypothetical protein
MMSPEPGGGHERRLVARIVNYADDFVICCRGTAEPAMVVMRRTMSKLKLTANETKTRRCRLPEETFDFLGYTLGRNYDRRTGAPYLGPRPSRKKISRLCGKISDPPLSTQGRVAQGVGCGRWVIASRQRPESDAASRTGIAGLRHITCRSGGH